MCFLNCNYVIMVKLGIWIKFKVVDNISTLMKLLKSVPVKSLRNGYLFVNNKVGRL